MIKVEKVEGCNNCNNCGKYNMQPYYIRNNSYMQLSNDLLLPENNNDIYDYHLLVNNGGICFRLCNNCAKELIIKLYKQLDKEN